MCLSYSGVRLEACSKRLRGVGLAGKLSTAGMMERWKLDEQRTVKEYRVQRRL